MINEICSNNGNIDVTNEENSLCVGDACDVVGSYGESARTWFAFGLNVIPVEFGSARPAVERELWLEDLSEVAIRAHWHQHPDHEVGFIPGDGFAVFSVDGKCAGLALYEFIRANDAIPNMVLKSPSGTHYLFKLDAGTTFSTPFAAADCIGVATGQSLVMLPPSAGVEQDMCQSVNASDLTVASQALVNAVWQYNASLVKAAVGTDVDLAVETPLAIGSTVSVAVPTEGGEAGGPNGAVVADTPFTAFCGQPSRASSLGVPSLSPVPAAADSTVFPAGPVEGRESGKGGVLPVASLKIDAGEFMALQAVALAVTSPKACDEPAIHHVGSEAEDDVLTPKAAENPVVLSLKARGLYKTPLGSGKHDITCPWVHEHAHDQDSATTYLEPSDLHVTGAYACQHVHAEKRHTKDLLQLLGVAKTDARHKAVIRTVAGDLHRVLDVAERELANQGQHFQSGGLIVSVQTDPVTRDPRIVATNTSTLTRELSQVAIWEKFDGRAQEYISTDPSPRQVSLLYGAQSYSHLPPLAGLARQPYLRQSDGVLITQAGYNSGSQLFGVFDPQKYPMPEPTRDAALAALAMLEDLIDEFHFAATTDKAATICAMLTAAQRISLPYAPGFHVQAPVFGSGKTLLCETIGAFAGPGANLKVSYPTTSEEATKVILSLLMTSPAVIEFDDMATDWIPHGTINRMLTSEKITDRILGVSKTATVSTRTLFLGSGNNVGPVRDVRRRVMTIHIDPRSASPATLSYRRNPLQRVRQYREQYVCAALTIVQAWRHAGSPSANIASIATYGGAWTDCCRLPLVWLGYPDPAMSLLEQLQSDPDSDALGALLSEWFKLFGSKPTTVRKALAAARFGNEELKDALCEFPIVERGEFNSSKLGWILKKNANRIVGGLEFKESEADGRKAWCVMAVNSPALPPSPPLVGPVAKTVTAETKAMVLDCDTADLY